jgi:predicted transglutaminase-like cysteine proteinase
MLMSNTTSLRSVLTALALLLAAPASQAVERHAALPPAASGLVAGGVARPITAWSDFCRRHAVECRVDGGEPEAVAMTAQLWRLVTDVNLKVNRAVKPLTDAEHWGVVDRWSFPDDGYGDCEDYQVLKRKRLADAGVPRRAMRMTVVLDENNEGHAVLMVRTDRGDYILDNKRDEVLPWHQTGYVFVKRESQDDVLWVSLNNSSGPIATAARR